MGRELGRREGLVLGAGKVATWARYDFVAVARASHWREARAGLVKVSDCGAAMRRLRTSAALKVWRGGGD